MHIREFQSMMRQIYFRRDFARGSAGTHAWLKDEVDELGEALENGDEKNILNEFADVLAWLASLANVVNVDLEAATLQKYHHKCPKCGHSPCICPT